MDTNILIDKEASIAEAIKSAGKNIKPTINNVGSKLKTILIDYDNAWNIHPIQTGVTTAAGVVIGSKAANALDKDDSNKEASQFSEFEKFALDAFDQLEQHLGRELTDLEKTALFGTLVNTAKSLAPKIFSSAKSVLSPQVISKAEIWGKAISTSWTRGTAQGLGTVSKISNAFRASAGANPLGTAAVTLGAGALGANLLKPKKPQALGMMPVYASDEGDYEKLAEDTKDDHRTRDRALMLLGGLGIGAALAGRNRIGITKVKNAKLLSETENLRGMGKNLVGKYSEFSTARDKEFKQMFDSIEDPRKNAIIQNTVRDIDKLIKETGNSLPKSKLRETSEINKELTGMVDKAEIPDEARKYLRDSINSKFRTKPYAGDDTGNFLDNMGNSMGSAPNFEEIFKNEYLRGNTKNSLGITPNFEDIFKR